MQSTGQTSTQVAYRSLFTGFVPDGDEEAARFDFEMRSRRSVLDLVLERRNQLVNSVGTADRQRLERHLMRLVDEAKADGRVAGSVDTRDAVRLITVFMHGLSANMAAGMSTAKARALLHGQLDLVLKPGKRKAR